jgi:hypothetical protein
MRVSLRLILLAGAAAGAAALWHLRSADPLQREIRQLGGEAGPALGVPKPEYIDTHPLEGLKGSPYGERGGQ